MEFDYRVSLAGLLIGTLIGLTGMGGGSLLAPIMILIFKVPPVWAVATDIAYSTITKAVGSIVHIRERNVNFKIALLLACGSIPATLLSVGLVHYLRQEFNDFIEGFILDALGVTLLIVAVLMVAKPFIFTYLERRNLERQKRAALEAQETEILVQAPTLWERRYRPILTVLVGAVVGFLVGLTSVGSGTLIIVSLSFMFPRLVAKELVGTDVFQAFLLLTAGLIGYLGSGTINWPMVLMLLVGSVPGVFIGSKLSRYVPDKFLRPVLAIVLAISAWKLL